MNDKHVSADNYCRLASSIIEKFDLSYDQAIEKLDQLTLLLECGDKILTSFSLQVALLTSINTGKRAFLGGVFVSLPNDTPCLLPWPGNKSLNRIIEDLGGKILKTESAAPSFTLRFGLTANVDQNSLQVICNNWQGGVISDENVEFPDERQIIPLGGVAAGSIGVGIAFLRTTGIDISVGDKPIGISLWRPDLNWLEKDAKGINVEYLPKKYWLLGLGHLGQAYIWCIGLLPYRDTSKPCVMLQDYDRIVKANWSAGLLSEQDNLMQFKTRVCSKWLEERGFETKITERKFDKHTVRCEGEPFVALCGFDNAESRTLLESAGFDLIVESALGGNLSMFDGITLHTFPNSLQQAEKIWENIDRKEVIKNPTVLRYLLSLETDDCGIVAKNIANKAISSSFVGALSGALVISELIRSLHTGTKYDKIDIQIRDIKSSRAIASKISRYDGTELRKDGYLNI